MPSSTPDLKASLVNDLWLPLVKSGGDQLFPRRKKHKRMRLFTLTDMNYQEIRAFEESKLTKREDVVAWNHSHLQALRLETDLGRSKVLCEGRFDDAIDEERQALSDHLPYDILNLDFSSQQPISSSNGRIEREINAASVLVNLLNNHQTNGFVFLYTTLFDQIDLSLDSLAFSLSELGAFSDPACCVSDKVEFVRSAVFSIVHINSYTLNELSELLVDTNNPTDKVFSIGFVSSRSN
jgi:hypothetical protein